MSETDRRKMNFVGVRFQVAGRPYHFKIPHDITVTAHDWLVVSTVYGEQVGQAVELRHALPEGLSRNTVRAVLRVANGLDMARHQVMRERAERMLEVAQEEIQAHNMDIKVFSAEFTLSGDNALVMCTGNLNKSHLATLRRRLASRMNCCIELRTVGPRDHAKMLGGHGICGEERCCVRFLTEFQAVSIRMAKNQAISMAPTDITGMCGRLRCCLAFEHDVYVQASKSLPRIKSRVKTEKGLGRVIDLDILKGDVIVEIPPDGPRVNRERFRFAAEDVEVQPRNTNK